MPKRPRSDSDITIYEQMAIKRTRIINKIIDTIDNPHKEICKSKDIKINNINFNIDVGQYNVQITTIFGVHKFSCSCNPKGVYFNFTNNYCKHIAYALSEIVKLYVKENNTFFKEKKSDLEMKENIEILKCNIKNINIHDK